jgi:glycosyltransferase involved in cell wall biosynthesis
VANPAQLTVVIPYYKRRFLAATLESFANQSDQRFQVFIGNDASPEDPTDLVERYRSRLTLNYHRFADNWGGRSVVAQWNRCIRCIQSEWVWLFSDDDTVSADCVAGFHEMLSSQASASDVYRFQSSVIDERGDTLRSSPENPARESAADLALCRMLGHREFYVQNHIFSRTSFDRCGGMVDFPCGLFSDDASSAAMSRATGIITLPRGRLFWRQSAINLNAGRPELVDQKLAAFTQYLSWADRTFHDEGPDFRRRLRTGASSWIRRSVSYLGGIPSRGSQLKFYWFFFRLSPLRFFRVYRGTRALWNR